MTTTKDRTCAKRIDESLRSRLADLRKLFNLYCEGNDEGDKELGTFNEYGLCFDYVAPGTFDDQEQGYFRYQLSWGGPSDEFRFFVNPDLSVHTIEYWFLDWGDGASLDLEAGDFTFMEEIFDHFRECGCYNIH